MTQIILSRFYFPNNRRTSWDSKRKPQTLSQDTNSTFQTSIKQPNDITKAGFDEAYVQIKSTFSQKQFQVVCCDFNFPYVNARIQFISYFIPIHDKN